MTLQRRGSAALGWLALVSVLAFQTRLEANLFPQLSARYPVGDARSVNPLDRSRDGPKALASGDLNSDGRADIISANLDGSVSVLLADDSGGLRDQILCPARDLLAGSSLRAVTVADFDGDGDQDVAAADIARGGVVILLGTDDGSLVPVKRIPLGPARALAAGDVNGDGEADLLVACTRPDCDRKRRNPSGSLHVILGRLYSHLPAASHSLELPAFLYDVALADIDQDGDLDALALDYTHRKILIFNGNGNGDFGPGPELDIPGRGARAFCVGHLDERVVDGHLPPGATLDVAVANRSSGTLNIFLGQGGRDFSEPLTIASGSSPRSVAAGDLNGDGFAELIVANRNGNTVSVMRGLGEGRFSTPLEIAAGASPRCAVVADVTGDGVLDAAVSNRISGDVSLFVGRRGLAGFLVPESYYPAGITPVGLVAGDFNEDGAPDVATVNLRSHDVRVRLNERDGELGPEAIYAVNFEPSSLAAGDVNGDGHTDLVTACLGSTGDPRSSRQGSLVALLGRGDGTFSLPVPTTTGETALHPYWVRLGDLSGDGVLDAAVSGLRGKIVLFRGRGDGMFDPPVTVPIGKGGRPTTITLGDFNNDGRLDLATSRGKVVLNNGALFTQVDEALLARIDPGDMRSFRVGRGDWVVESRDLDRDGTLDLVVALTFVEPDPIAVLFGVGDGTFGNPTIYETGMGVVSIAVEDMDGDGILDIVTGNRCTADVTIMKGLGDRRFERLETVRTYCVEGIAVTDLNRDGRPDLVGAGLALWALMNGGEVTLSDPEEANPCGVVPREGLYINEIMANNVSFHTDPREKTPDWFELFNYSAEERLLKGWVVREYSREGYVKNWTFPEGTRIGPKKHLVVFCDSGKKGGTKAADGTLLCRDFSLSRLGEGLALIDPRGRTVDRVDFPALPANVCYARFLDGARYLCYNPVPTLGVPNVRPTNMGPSVVAGEPSVSADGKKVRITARTFDDLGIAYASVHFRLEGQKAFDEVVLSDDGTHGDGESGDGVYGALLPPMPEGSTVLYYLRVVDLEGEVAMSPDDPAVAEDLLRVTVGSPVVASAD